MKKKNVAEGTLKHRVLIMYTYLGGSGIDAEEECCKNIGMRSSKARERLSSKEQRALSVKAK